MFYPRWSKNSVNFVKDLLDDSSHFLSYAAFTQKYKFYPNFLEYYGLVSAVRDFKVKCNTANIVSQRKEFHLSLRCNNFSKLVYDNIIEKKSYNT